MQLTLLFFQRHGSLASANTCHGVQGYTGFHTYRPDKTGDGVSVFIKNCYTSTHMAKFSVCDVYYEISVVKVSLSNNCTVIIIGIYRPPDKSKIREFTIKLNEILSSTSQSDHVFIVGGLNINSFLIPLPQKMILLTTATQTPSSLSSINPLAILITILLFWIIYGLISCMTHSVVFFYLI